MLCKQLTLYLATGLMVLFLSLSQRCVAQEVNGARAKFNYQMLCQGCHTPDGSGKKSVPELKGFIGNFLATQEGREYLIKVPGAANSALDDKELAEVMNWIIVEMGQDSVPKNMQPYTGAEVGKYRADSLFEVIEYRKAIISRLPTSKQ